VRINAEKYEELSFFFEKIIEKFQENVVLTKLKVEFKQTFHFYTKKPYMPYQAKTKETNDSISTFIESFVEKADKKAASFRLVELMQNWTGYEPKMWGPSIIGFGQYHYKYDSGHEGDAPLLGFSPRKAAFSLYFYFPTSENDYLLTKLGKYKMGKACIYVNKLEDIDLEIAQKICLNTIAELRRRYV
jgi:hypothetical protein